jgi:hypothetical protein
MDHLRCRTPHRVRNEFHMHLTTYNLIRQLLAVTAARAGREPWMISFKGAQQTISKLLSLLANPITTEAWCKAVFDAIQSHVVGNRPDRYEPRVRKRRPKAYPLMQRSREEYKRRMAA